MVTVFNKPISNETHIMTGATSENPGTAGLAPAPAIGDQSKVLTGAGVWGLPGVVTINGRAPNPVTGDIVVIEGGGSSSYGSYRLDATITPSDWVANNGVYVAVVTNQYITSGMDGSETWLDNEYAQLGDAEFISDTGTLTITTTVQPTENWNLHASLAVNGADVLADVSAIRTNINEITTNLGSPTSASGVAGADAFSKINTINNLIGAVPSGETVEGQITSLNSNIENVVMASITSVPSGVTLRNVSLRKNAKVVSGYIEVSAPGKEASTLGTISNTGHYPAARVYFPMWSASSSQYLGFVDISSSGVVTTHPISGLQATETIACHVDYITN